MSSHYNAPVGAHFKSNALSASVFLEHDADGVNDFLVQVSVATDDHVVSSSLGRRRPVQLQATLESGLCSFAREGAISEG